MLTADKNVAAVCDALDAALPTAKQSTKARTAKETPVVVDTWQSCKAGFIKTFNELSYKHNHHALFKDFCLMAAHSIANTTHKGLVPERLQDAAQWKRREEEYLRVVRKYSRDEASHFAELLSWVTRGLSTRWGDFIGELYGDLEVYNKHSGQFFTPYEVSSMMARMTMGGELDAWPENKRAVTLYDPCCGAGSTLIAACEHVANIAKLHRLHVTAVDIDLTCVHMSYIQLSLLGVSAFVFHGDTLQMETYDCFVTPGMYLSGLAYVNVWKDTAPNEPTAHCQLATWQVLHKTAAEKHAAFFKEG